VISGAHAIIYSKDADADRAFLKDVLGLSHVDVGGGWLIFSLPPSEVAVHPWERNDRHELFFLVKDVEAFIAKMRARKVPVSAIQEERWGRLTQVTLPGGGTIGVYQPRHAAPPARRPAATKTTRRRTPKPKARPKTRRR
jgi:catechol 2,3-dioxygenase-like lactoylglutathione lyase family enzyme